MSYAWRNGLYFVLFAQRYGNKLEIESENSVSFVVMSTIELVIFYYFMFVLYGLWGQSFSEVAMKYEDPIQVYYIQYKQSRVRVAKEIWSLVSFSNRQENSKDIEMAGVFSTNWHAFKSAIQSCSNISKDRLKEDILKIYVIYDRIKIDNNKSYAIYTKDDKMKDFFAIQEQKRQTEEANRLSQVRMKKLQRLDWFKKQQLHFSELEDRIKRAQGRSKNSSDMESVRQILLGKAVAEEQIKELRAEISKPNQTKVTKRDPKLTEWGKKIGILNLRDYCSWVFGNKQNRFFYSSIIMMLIFLFCSSTITKTEQHWQVNTSVAKSLEWIRYTRDWTFFNNGYGVYLLAEFYELAILDSNYFDRYPFFNNFPWTRATG
jgi:hypothetical protein